MSGGKRRKAEQFCVLGVTCGDMLAHMPCKRNEGPHMMAPLARQTAANAALFLTFTMLFWAGNHVVGRWAGAHIPPVTLAALRWTGATILLAPFAWRSLREDWAIVRARLPFLAVLGVLGGALFNTLQYMALVHTSAISAAVLNSVTPILIVSVAFLLLGERVRAVQAAGIATSLLGVLIVLGKGDPRALLSSQLNRGDVYMLVALALWSVYSVLLQKRPAMHGLSFALVTFFIAAALNLLLAAGEMAMGSGGFEVTPQIVGAIGYVVVFPSLLAYLCYNRGVQIIGASRAGVFIHLVPMFTAVLAMLFLGEHPEPFHAAGFVLILAGVWLGSRPRKCQPREFSLGCACSSAWRRAACAGRRS